MQSLTVLELCVVKFDKNARVGYTVYHIDHIRAFNYLRGVRDRTLIFYICYFALALLPFSGV